MDRTAERVQAALGEPGQSPVRKGTRSESQWPSAASVALAAAGPTVS